MAVYVVAYDLDQPGQNYPALVNALEKVGAVRVQLSLWLLQDSGAATEVRDWVRNHTDANDRVFVAEISVSRWAGWKMMTGAAEWLKARA